MIKYFKGIVISLLTLFCLCSMGQDKVQVLFLGGQSNMAGRGVYADLSDADKARIEKVSKRVMVSAQGRDAYPLSYYTDGKHQKEFGPELFIGLKLAEAYPDRSFLFIKRAVGGTSLHGAWSPDWTEAKALASERGEARQKMKLYGEHIADIKKNLGKLKQKGKRYEIIGMAWMQGEKDSRLELSATKYEVNLKRLIGAYRTEFKLPNMPFVLGQINNPVRGKKDYQNGPAEVRRAIENVSNSDHNVKMIPTSTDPSWKDFPKREDNVHYTAEGQKRLGTAMGKALLELVYSSK